MTLCTKMSIVCHMQNMKITGKSQNPNNAIVLTFYLFLISMQWCIAVKFAKGCQNSFIFMENKGLPLSGFFHVLAAMTNSSFFNLVKLAEI